MTSRKKAPALSARDQAVWQEVTKSVTPLGDRPEAPPPPKAMRPDRRLDNALPQEWFMGAGLESGADPTPQLDRKTRRNITKGRREFDRSVDLHGMTQDHAFNTLKSVIEGCVRRGDKTVLVVTGKGGKRFSQLEASTPVSFRTRNDFEQHAGVLKRMVPMWLSGPDLKPFVHSYGPAAQEHGGDGALYVVLRGRPPGAKKGSK